MVIIFFLKINKENKKANTLQFFKENQKQQNFTLFI
jgi:hypothetical protein